VGSVNTQGLDFSSLLRPGIASLQDLMPVEVCKTTAPLLQTTLCHDFAPGFENLFDEGVNNGLYDASNPLEK
jgi:hypothetical protein